MSSPWVVVRGQIKYIAHRKKHDENSDCTVDSVLLNSFTICGDESLLKDGRAHWTGTSERTVFPQTQNP